MGSIANADRAVPAWMPGAHEGLRLLEGRNLPEPSDFGAATRRDEGGFTTESVRLTPQQGFAYERAVQRVFSDDDLVGSIVANARVATYGVAHAYPLAAQNRLAIAVDGLAELESRYLRPPATAPGAPSGQDIEALWTARSAVFDAVRAAEQLGDPATGRREQAIISSGAVGYYAVD